jgi:DNA-binding NtrC family response regulator
VKPGTVLVVDDDARLLETLAILVRSIGHDCLTAGDVPTASKILAEREVEVVVTDVRMPGGSGLDLLDVVSRAGRGTPVIVITAYGTVESAVQAMQRGAFDYVLKPFDAGEMEVRIDRALEVRRMRMENVYLREALSETGGFDELIGVSTAIRKVFALVQQVAPSKASVLITGETGTGKELVARAIHRRSPRADALLVPVNLAAVPMELLESELFGHARGAFTSAIADRPGKFEVANAGTLFLDEVGDAPLALQPKLLRVLQDGVVERVGGTQPRAVDVRLISATNRNLEAEVSTGRFRADLFYRLRVIQIPMPPLRERREDIRYLVGHFLRKFGRPGRDLGISAPAATARGLFLAGERPRAGERDRARSGARAGRRHRRRSARSPHARRTGCGRGSARPPRRRPRPSGARDDPAGARGNEAGEGTGRSGARHQRTQPVVQAAEARAHVSAPAPRHAAAALPHRLTARWIPSHRGARRARARAVGTGCWQQAVCQRCWPGPVIAAA